MPEGAGTPPLPDGSIPYYVVRFADSAQRARLRAAFALAAELERSVARSSDPGVTRLKFDWWRRELAAAADSAHPLVRQLAPLAGSAGGLAALQDMLDAAEQDVRKQQPADTSSFHAQCRRAGALARLLGDSGATDAAAADTLGQYSSAVQRIQLLGQHLRRGYNPLPADSGLLGDPAGWSDAALAQICAGLLDPLAQAAAPLLRSRDPELRAVRRWAAQARALHRLLARERYAVRDRYLDTTPVARLWAAWRVR
jgi:phytoene/squalene synthetase